ncbi:MAG TPA: ABC transporter permease [Lachnospiraceae bacterium]|nr:ABC transporter permease [Lachnospiraceae bacterium]HIS61644.1 ABC transporter permease [Candidatus Scybalomonas excrementigallinarum]
MGAWLVSIEGAISQGIIYGIMALGVYITFRIMDIADLTVDGSFALGSCLCAALMVNYGMNAIVALILSLGAGILAGAVTGFLHTVLEIPAILAGILTQIGLWSINLRIMSGAANITLLNQKTIFTSLVERTGWTQASVVLVIGLVIVAILVIILYWLFGTEIGAALRATGNNEHMIRALGVNVKWTKVLALMISNGLVGLSGGLVCQMNKFGDINSGTGSIVIGLAAIVIGEMFMKKCLSFGSKLVSAVLGSMIYFVIRAIVLRLGMNPNDMKLLSAVLVAVALCIPVLAGKWKMKHSYIEGGE